MMWNILGILAAAYGGLSLWLFVFQSNMVFYPEIDREVAATPALAKLQYEELHLKTSDEIDLHGWFVPAPQPRGSVLFLHGNAGEHFSPHRFGADVFIFMHGSWVKAL